MGRSPFRRLSRAIAWAAFAVVAAPASVSAADPNPLKNVIQLPCGREPFGKCETIPQSVLEKKNAAGEPIFESLVREMIDGVYEGKFYPNGKGDSEGNRAFETVGAPPICAAMPFAEKSCREEKEKNWRGDRCLPYARVGYTSLDKGAFSLRMTGGSAETSRMASFLVLAISEEAETIREEIRANRFAIDPNGGCAVQGRRLHDLVEAQRKVPGVESIPRCDVSNTQACSVRKYFDASMESIVMGYLYVARCRLAENAAKAYRQTTRDYIAALETAAYRPCLQSCDAETECLQRCYEAKAARWIDDQASQNFRRVASGCGRK